MIRRFLVTLIITAGLLVMANFSAAEEPVFINYQGTLADSSGNPVPDSIYYMWFGLYNTNVGGMPLWYEDQYVVPVTGGLFRVLLGSEVGLYPYMLDEESLYLQISLESGALTPRIRLTDVPYAVYARYLKGEIEARPGSLLMQNAAGDTGIGFSFDTFGNWMKFNWALNSPYENEPAVEISSAPDGIASMDFYKPGAPSEGVVQMGYDPSKGGFLEIHSSEPTFASRVRLSGSVTDTGKVTLFGGVHGADYPLMELRSHTLEGASIFMFNPQPEPPHDPLLEMRGMPATGATMDFYKPDAPSEGVVQMGYAPDKGGFLEIHAAEPTFASRVRLTGTATDTGIVTMYGGPHGGVYPLLEMRTHTEEGASFSIFNPQVSRTPDDAVKIMSDSSGGSMEFYDESGSDVWLKVETAGEGGDMTFYDSTGAGSIILSSSGNVGIGTLTPGYELQVNGQAISGLNSTVSGDYSTISGGNNNTVSAYGATVSGGENNTANSNLATVGGGQLNVASAYRTTVGGGQSNTANGHYSTVSGGFVNRATDFCATVGGGSYCKARGEYSVVAGGGGADQADSNSAIGDYSTVSGGSNNNAGYFCTVGGGYQNVASDTNSTVSGGGENTASGWYSTVSGGKNNAANNTYATICGGSSNTADHSSTVGGGFGNGASGTYNTIGGGRLNATSDVNSTIGGGYDNTASSYCAVIAGGCSGSADGEYSSVGGGSNNTAQGIASTVPGGMDNLAEGDYTVAMGRQAQAVHNGSFVWADGSGGEYVTTADYQFLIRAGGGVGIGTNSPQHQLDVTGDIRASGNMECVALNQASDLRLKTDINPIIDALSKVERLQGVSFRWNQDAKLIGANPGSEQIGIIAQDVEQVFPELVSTPENGYKSVDYTKLTAVLIEALKELHTKNNELKNDIDELKDEIAELKQK